MINFAQFFEQRNRKYKIIVEAFDPAVAAEKNPNHMVTKVAGVDVVIPINKKNTNKSEEDTITINQSDLMKADSSFCDVVPGIKKFASESPENMFYVLGLVVGTIGSSWPKFRNLYPIYAAYVKATNGSEKEIEFIVGLDGKKEPVKAWFYKGASNHIKALWRNREFLYNKIYGEKLIDDEFELYRFLNRYFQGAATIKAGFSVQLLSGKIGCIDNINADVYGFPISITNKSGKQVESPNFKTQKKVKTDILTPAGEQILTDYINFIKAIGEFTKSDASQRLWDDWVQLAAAKTIFAGKRIRFVLVDGRSVIMPTYTNATNKDKKYTEYLQNLKKDGVDPYGGYEIGKEHLSLPKMGSELGDKEAKSRIKFK